MKTVKIRSYFWSVFSSIHVVLGLTFRVCIDQGLSPDLWKKPILFSVHKKWSTLDRELYTSFSTSYFRRNTKRIAVKFNLISQIQSRFKQRDFSINQLLSVTRDIDQSLDDGWYFIGFWQSMAQRFNMKIKMWNIRKIGYKNERLFLSIGTKELF